ncbi:MAG: hypothetical protein ACRDGR_09630, partial [bacterium]
MGSSCAGAATGCIPICGTSFRSRRSARPRSRSRRRSLDLRLARVLLASAALAVPADATERDARPLRVPLDVVGPPGFVRGGVPFPPGRLRPDDRVAIEGASSAATEVLARWGDGSVRWLLVEAVAESALTLTRGKPTEGPGVDADGLSDDLTLLVDGARADVSGARWRVERETPLSVRLAAEGTTPG